MNRKRVNDLNINTHEYISCIHENREMVNKHENLHNIVCHCVISVIQIETTRDAITPIRKALKSKIDYTKCWQQLVATGI